ncbi:MAG: folate-binding protein YgfZ [Magnetospirillum gryphiswaldense]|nr:folate-binding protein YgfZ [Magnetospirillum gryphiswaldense]
MPAFQFTRLSRSVLIVAGDDRKIFLQGLVSNDVNKVSADKALYAAFLTAQGKFLWDLFLVEQGDTILIDVDQASAETFKKKLSLYKLRAKVSIEMSDLTVFAIWGGDGTLPAGAVADGRLAEMGGRIYAAQAPAGLAEAPLAAWDALRFALGVPDGARDLIADKSLLLENGFDELGGVDFDKGCYMGQELTARTKYRGLIRKRLLPVRFDGDAPQAGTPVLAGEAEAGEMRSGGVGAGLAMVRLEHLQAGTPLTCGGKALSLTVPNWAVLPEAD